MKWAKKLGKSPLPYDLTPSAESDLKGIAKITLEKWGRKQTGVYANKLEQCFQKIAANKLVPRTFSKRFPQLKSVKCEHHYVFYILPKNKRPVIIAVLHEHMDILTRLAARL